MSLSNTFSAPVSVNYQTASGSALADIDFVSTAGVLTIPAGQTTGSITITVMDDGSPEGVETFTLQLSNPVNAVITDSVGTCVITNTFAAASDPYWENVTLLMHADGADGQTSTVDSSAYSRTITAAGTVLPTLSATTKKFGASSMAFTGSFNSAFTCDPSADTQFGTGDFTIEFFVNAASFANQPYLVANRSGGAGGFGWYIVADSNGIVRLYSDSTVFVSAGSVPLNTWSHVAFSRVAGTIYGFIDGVLSSSVVNSEDFTLVTRPLAIGRDNSSGNNLNGFIDELRITKGVGRYSSNFTAPTAEFPAAGTVSGQ